MKTISSNYNGRYVGELQSDRDQQMNKQFEESLRFEEGKVYIKVIKETSVHSFIVKEDGPKFKKGDILKAASWKSPTKNFSRGNIFIPSSYELVSWTGA